MSKRFTDTQIWDKEWFMSLSCKHKCLVRYIFDKCDSAGLWQPNWVLASTYIGEKVSAADLSVLKKQIAQLPDGKIFIVDFIEFQYGELTETCHPHRKIIAILKKAGLYERVTEGYFKGNNTLQDMEEDKEEDKDKEKEEEKKTRKTKNEEPQELVNPFSDRFMVHWQTWKDYKRQQQNFTYKSVITEQAAINDLVKISKGDEIEAGKIIMQSIAKGWKGFFELKNGDNETRVVPIDKDKLKEKLAERIRARG
jgi:hypothetical protein